MSSQGSPHTRFKRALATGDPTIATAAALELPRVLLEDALALVLLYHRAGDERFERAALRWHARLCAEVPAVSLACAAAALQALATLGRGEESRAMGILAEVLDALEAHQLAKPLEEQARRAGR
jgi:uncharacterized protein with PIN domain